MPPSEHRLPAEVSPVEVFGGGSSVARACALFSNEASSRPCSYGGDTIAYAENTSVDPMSSRAEIERILSRYGARAFGYAHAQDDKAIIVFQANGRRVRFMLPLPTKEDVNRTPTGRKRTGDALENALDQEHRRRWRALALCIKAKLEAVESGIVSFDEEFAAHIMLPNGQSVGEWLVPQIEESYGSGEMPALLPGVG